MVTQEYYVGVDLGQKRARRRLLWWSARGPRGDSESGDVGDGVAGFVATAAVGAAFGAGLTGEFVC